MVTVFFGIKYIIELKSMIHAGLPISEDLRII